MKKILLGFLALSAISMANDNAIKFDTNKMYLNTRVGIDTLAKYDEADELSGNTKGFSGEIALEGYQTLIENFDLGLGLAYQTHTDRAEKNVSNRVGTTKGGEYKSLPLYITGKYNFDTKSKLKPYLKANLGYSINFDATNVESSKLENTETKIDNGLYYGLGGGVEFNNFNIDLIYAVNKATGTSKATGDSDSFDYGRFTLSAGYRFNL